jgi:anti-sigma B factor antagonist
MPDGSQFRAELVRDGQQTVIEVHGEAGFSAAPEFEKVLLNSFEDDTIAVIVDLTGARLTDNAILGTLVAGAKRARFRRVHLDVICPDQSVARVFEITGLDRIFGFYGSRDEALRAERRGTGLMATTGRSHARRARV